MPITKYPMYWHLIHKFLSNQCSPAERRQVEQWLSEDPEHRVFMRSIREIWNVTPKQEGTVDVKAAWRRFRAERMTPPQIHSLRSTNNLSSHNSVHFAHPLPASQLKWYQKPSVYAAAAAVLLLVAVLFVARMQLNQSAKITYQQVVTGKGEKTSLKLSDGTRVKLNAESVLKIPSNYGGAKRTLYLVEGEAFFKVKHVPSTPFKVYSGGVYTQDIGTQFNIRAFPEDSTIAIVVAEEKVAVGKAQAQKQKPIVLSYKERAIVSKEGKTNIQQVTDLSSYIGWTQGKLVFRDTRFKNVTKQLERWYGVECLVEDKMLLNQKFTATFANEPLANVLKLISKSMGINAHMEEQTVVFSVRQTKGR